MKHYPLTLKVGRPYWYKLIFILIIVTCCVRQSDANYNPLNDSILDRVNMLDDTVLHDATPCEDFYSLMKKGKERTTPALPMPDVTVTVNESAYCSGELLDIDITTTSPGGGVTFDLIIAETSDLSFPADLEDDQTFPMVFNDLVVLDAGPFQLSSVVPAILNQTGDFDPGRISIGLQNIRLTDDPLMTAADIPADPGVGRDAIIKPTPSLLPNPISETICSGTDFSIEMTTSLTSQLGFDDLEFLLTNISDNPDLDEGNTLTPNITVLGVGNFLSEVLNNNTAVNQEVTYTLRPQLNSSRLDADDPTTATCVAGLVDITISVIPIPTASLTGLSDICIENGVIDIIGSPSLGIPIFTTTAPAGLTDNMDGTATFDPLLSGVGSFEMTYQFVEPINGCVGTYMQSFTVSSCVPSISIIDPCTCRENPVGSGGNATTLDNGQFEETILVTAPNAQTWYIDTVTGLYDIASPHPLLSPTQLLTGPAGISMVEGPAGVYTLEGIHVDALGYSIELTNGVDVLSISNTCFYPNPVIDPPLRDGYCTSLDPITLEGNGNGASGVGVFDILESDGITVIENNATELDPSALAAGTYFVRYTFDEDPNPVLPCQNCNPGCTQAIYHEFDIVDQSATMACNTSITISLDSDCISEVEPDMVLEGNYPSYGIYDVELFNYFVPIGNTLTANEIGEDIQVTVTDICTGNSCWGNIQVEDKLKPFFDCPTDTVQINCNEDPSLVPIPILTDNCDGIIETSLLAETTENFDCGLADGTIYRIIRVWGGEDAQGNTADNCTQLIDVIRVDLVDLVLPLSLDNISLPALDCSTTNIEPSITGFPTVGGTPINEDDYCSISVSWSDDVFDNCGGSTDINRNWVIFDWCAPTTANNPIFYTQVIKLMDTTPPTIVAPDDATISASNSNCTGSVILPEATISDDCSGYSVSVSTPAGFLNSNGGLITNLPLGTHIIIYSVVDDCGNIATDQMQLTVVDDVPPIPICDEITVASLNNIGEVEVFATSFDDGSFDYCTSVTVSAKIMGSSEPFAPSVTFDCDDVGLDIQVIMQVMDIYGNVNSCMVTVHVQNKIGPIISCPSDITINCTEDPYDIIDVTGSATFFTNCSIASTGYNDILTNVNSCSEGSILRAFFVQDVHGNDTTCQQVITLVNMDPFDAGDISFPEDYMISDCINSNSLHPDSLPSSPVNYSYPIFDDQSCTLIATNFEDLVLTVAPPACFAIQRTWTLIDWCQYDPDNPTAGGLFQQEQQILVLDTIAPILTCPDSLLVEFEDPVCSTTVSLEMPQVDDCNPDVQVFSNGDLGIGFGPFSNVGEGVYEVMYSASDGCNNVSTCTYNVTVVDGKKPSPVCTGLITEIMPSVGMITVDASLFDASSADNCTDPANLIFAFADNPDSLTMTFTCDNLGVNDVEIWVFDEAGNSDLCVTQIEIQDNNDVCSQDNLVVIEGEVITDNNEAINIVSIDINGTNSASFTTDENGTYSFQDLPAGGDYTITPNKDLGLLNGVTTLDLTFISRHILEIELIESPYKLIAADINKNGAITTTDLVALRKVILLIDDEFPNNTSWRFIEADFEFTDPTNPFLDDFPEFLNFNNLDSSVEANFLGIKIGDINGTVNPAELLSADDRNVNSTSIEVNEEILIPNKEKRIDFYYNHKALMGFQFALQLSEGIAIEKIICEGLLEEGNIAEFKDKGSISVSWHSSNLLEFEEPQLLFSLILRSDKKIKVSEGIRIEGNKIPGELYEDLENITTPKLIFHKEEIIHDYDSVRLYQNYPNPFEESTSIKFYLPEEQEVELKIRTINGVEVYSFEGVYKKGLNTININRNENMESGILMYQLLVNDEKHVKKMIVIN